MTEAVFHVDETSDLPIWVQLRNRIAYLIRTGYFKPGEQVPSVRSMSASARINYNTVSKAYNDLETSGLIVSIRGRGMFVQKDLVNDDKSEEEAVDAILDECIRNYHLLGMPFKDIKTKLMEQIDRMENAALSAEREKREYLDAE